MKGLKSLSDIVPENSRRITLEAKLDNCRAMLLIQGLLTVEESNRVAARLNHRIKQESSKCPVLQSNIRCPKPHEYP